MRCGRYSVIAGEPIPVEALFQLLKIDDEQKAAAKANGKMPVARLDQLEAAMCEANLKYARYVSTLTLVFSSRVSSVEESDTSEKYRKFLTEQIERFEVIYCAGCLDLRIGI